MLIMFHLLLTHTPLLYVVQSFWRDEAFSVLAAKGSLWFIVTKLGFEPPVYYTLLHYWIRIFGEGDIAARCLSFLGYLLATAVIIKWSEELYKKHWLSIFLPVFFFLNPMLLYYAFEVRTYAWYTFFSILTLYGYVNKKWLLFLIGAVLGFYTHVYLLLFLGALFIHWMITTKPNPLRLFTYLKKDPALRSFIAVGLLMIPWLVKIGLEAKRLSSSWYFPVNMQLVYSVLGNMFTGYEGTPWYGWRYTAYLSLIIVGLTALALTNQKHRARTVLFIMYGAIPLAVIIGISFFKPLFVNRYLIPATVAEVLIIVAALDAIRIGWLQKAAAGALLLSVLWINWWYPPQHAKVPLRDTLMQINSLVKDNDVILADNALIYLETLYYAKDRSRVYLYNPNHAPFPWYIGEALFSPSRMMDDYPLYPNHAYIVHGNASFDIAYRMPMGTRAAPIKK